MKTHPTVAEAQAQSERAPCSAPHGAVVASARACPVCGTPLHGRQESCSARCRAAKSRRGRVPLPVEDARDIRARLNAALDIIYQAKATLDRYVGG